MENRGTSLGTFRKNSPTNLPHGPSSTTRSTKGTMPEGVRRKGVRTKSAHPDSSSRSSWGDLGGQVSAAKGKGNSVGFGKVSAPKTVGDTGESKSVPLAYHGGESATHASPDGIKVQRRQRPFYTEVEA